MSIIVTTEPIVGFTLTAAQRYPAGTTVSVYPRLQRAANGPPSGAAVTSAVATATSVTFTVLTGGVKYVAYALVGGEHRYVEFTA